MCKKCTLGQDSSVCHEPFRAVSLDILSWYEICYKKQLMEPPDRYATRSDIVPEQRPNYLTDSVRVGREYNTKGDFGALNLFSDR